MKRFFLSLLALLLCAVAPAAAQSRRVALVVGQDAYPDSDTAAKGLPRLDNSRLDARRMAALLAKAGFDVISCDGKSPGCFDLDGRGLARALGLLRGKAAGADLALVYFAGHGMATEQGNILAPTDARVDCASGAVTRGVLVEDMLKAAAAARDRLVILDACRDNPLARVCPGLAGRKLSFTRIEPADMNNLLIVTSTQFGQQALDGEKGQHSPFAAALFTALESYPNIYFEQVMNEVARATAAAALKQNGFKQIPGKVVGGAAPADCLSGRACVGDARMAALAAQVETLAAESTAARIDAAGVRKLRAAEEAARGKPYTGQEWAARLADIERITGTMAASSEPKRQEASRLIKGGDLAAGSAKLDEALDDDERAIAAAEQVAAAKRKAAAQTAREAAVLARGTSVAKALDYYRRAVKLDPADADTWNALARAAVDAGRLDEAKAAFGQAAETARAAKAARDEYWATLGLGDVAVEQGDLPGARRHYDAAGTIANRLAKADPGSPGGHGSAMTLEWQRDLSVSQEKIGDVLRAQGNLSAALDAFKASLAIRERLATSDPGNAGWQRDLSVSNYKIGQLLLKSDRAKEALPYFEADLAIAERLARLAPDNAQWQKDVALSRRMVEEVRRAVRK